VEDGPHLGGDYALIAAMSGWIPMMFMTREIVCEHVQAHCVFIRKWVAPIRILRVAEGCSAVTRRTRMACGFLRRTGVEGRALTS
jgi:hypothetical protein